jgi:hypothetical protein
MGQSQVRNQSKCLKVGFYRTKQGQVLMKMSLANAPPAQIGVKVHARSSSERAPRPNGCKGAREKF